MGIRDRDGLVVLEEWAPGSQGWLTRRGVLHLVGGVGAGVGVGLRRDESWGRIGCRLRRARRRGEAGGRWCGGGGGGRKRGTESTRVWGIAYVRVCRWS